jgi:aspartate aminotransferase-like enzyme
VKAARKNVADLMGCPSSCVVFTGSASEANNIALGGVMRSSPRGSHLVISAAEHNSVLSSAEQLRSEGFEVTILPVDEQCAVDPRSVAANLRENTVLVSVMFANNEVGTLNPIDEIGSATTRRPDASTAPPWVYWPWPSNSAICRFTSYERRHELQFDSRKVAAARTSCASRASLLMQGLGR